MITIRDNLIIIETQDTSYILSTARDGLLENLYYGEKVHLDGATPILPKVDGGFGGDVLRVDGGVALSSLMLELSPQNRGDYRLGALAAEMPQGGATSDFAFAAAILQDGPAPSGGMPQGRQPDKVLMVSFTEPSGLSVDLFYSVFYECNVITKKMRVTNRAENPLRLRRAMSTQLDLPRCDYDLVTFTGAWGREFDLTTHPLAAGIHRFGSNTGASGNKCNPFFMLCEHGATEQFGGVYGFNLVYSGSHEGSVEVDSFGRTRIMQGLQTEGFAWRLAPGESFIIPEAVLTYSAQGKTGMSHNMHRFIKRHILPPQWATRPRPVLVNNWEGTYFNFNEGKLVAMAKVAAKVGAELFVLDDGWFGQRTSDKAGLGDYDVNPQKLPGGLAALAGRINNLGLDFGLWFEPEMVNEDSKLFRAHPDWAVQTPGYKPATGRHQLVLDLCRPEVREYIIENVNATLNSANIKYVKWDMNRHIADNFSLALEEQGEFAHRFTLGLYELFDGICGPRPEVLFEGCSSGGNRFDLGILYYMPQIWLSDDSDAHERQRIQANASYGYPQCTMGCHVSAVPNHQTLRNTPLETRFNTAAFGLLGYELDMTLLTRNQRADVAAQIKFYKAHRRLLQYGDFYRLATPAKRGDACRWMVVAPSKREAMVGDYTGLLKPNSTQPPMRLTGLEGEKLYQIGVRPQKIDIEDFGGLINYVLPMHLNPDGLLVAAAGKFIRLDSEKEHYTAYGDLLCKAGLARMQEFSGAGYCDNLRFLSDFASRVYYVCEDGSELCIPPDTGKTMTEKLAEKLMPKGEG